MIRIEAGAFQMGQEQGGDFDERPVHKVTISRPFHLSATEVTNAQYEQYDPKHKALRGKNGFSKDDDEAVVFVSWEEAAEFCRWLARKEGKPYRLPSEAEWEYACRAGTTTPYHAGDKLPKEFHKNVKNSWFPSRGDEGDVLPLHVGRTPPNAWGLLDMHGNVEEWCADWYGPYPRGDQIDPAGRAEGDFRVTRGGSHSTLLEYLRSANRSGTLPLDKHWLIGFRVACGDPPKTPPLPPVPPRRWARDVRQEKTDWSAGPDMSKPYFEGPIQYVKIPPGSEGPLFSRHNHCPAVVACPNGDMLAIWYTCRTEPGRELGIAASRLRRGATEWEPAEPFWDAPDRNDHASALFLDDDGTIFHFNGLGAGGTWGALATVMRTSRDSGATWSRARLIMPEHGLHHMPIESVIKTRRGRLIVPCDAVPGGSGGSAVLVSDDGGKTWADPAEGKPIPDFSSGKSGAVMAGIHAALVELKDGRLLASGRGNSIDGKMPMSLSADGGCTWAYKASPFPPIGGGQRLVLTRLAEGPIFFASFGKSVEFTDSSGKTHKGSGLFAALSDDEGETWQVRRLITAGGPPRRVDGGGNTGPFTMSDMSAEPRGYMSIHQTPDRVIHLISSKQQYRFNLAWLRQAPPPRADAAASQERPADASAGAKPLPAKKDLTVVYRADQAPTKTRLAWRFSGSGTTEDKAVRLEGGRLTVTTGPGQRVRWIDDRADSFGSAKADKGHTVEIVLRVSRSTSQTRGVDLETVVAGPDGPRRSMITVTTNAVLWLDKKFAPLATGLDNGSADHVYRLAVDATGRAWVYRDGKLLGVRWAAATRDPLAQAGQTYIQWGEGAGGSEADFGIGSIAWDLSGAYRPAD
ncbi:MAG: Serine/threonine-protein kinase pkn1 [Planctomycetes bacterium ADurb.Bin126]|nr:MAG: Serine/threonine-protein kinase pkn1 [Planctomycetes bacterium ADurb.Bin126]